MRIDGQPRRMIWPERERAAVAVIDQRWLPHRVSIERLHDVQAVHRAVREMWVRGAPLIGAAAAYGVALQMLGDSSDRALTAAIEHLASARPTAVNLSWALKRMRGALAPLPEARRAEAAWVEAAAICDEDVACNRSIGQHGLEIIRSLAARRPGPVRVLTHCNAGALATVDVGTALAPVYAAHEAGLEVFVWVGETRPRNQGASLTAFELRQQGVAYKLIADNASGHLMQRGEVDLVLVGCDRVTACGDVCNKIGTYLRALAARDNGVPFYVAMPLSTFDPACRDGLSEIAIEERSAREVTHLLGRSADGGLIEVSIAPEGTQAANPAFDVTPARLVSGFITERGVASADEAALRSLAGATELYIGTVG
jgi:methylthioribose-1-phosphate isomerase